MVDVVHTSSATLTVGKLNRTAVAIAILGYVALIAVIAANRMYLNFGTETDLLGGFVPEAERLLRGEPLSVRYHPPLYSAVLAAIWTLVGDWFVAGLVISLASSVVALGCGYAIFTRLFGPWAGWGALIGLAGTGEFVYFAASATSDLFFLSLFLLSIWLAVEAIAAERRLLWWTCGLAVGCGVLARTNGIVLLLLVMAPFLVQAQAKQRVIDSGAVLAGLMLPLVCWLAYAMATGSPFWPTNTYANLALTYFSPTEDRISGDAILLVESRFASLTEVLLHDPLHIAKTYAADGRTLFTWSIPSMMNFPLSLLFLPGLLLIMAKSFDRTVLFFLAILGAHVALVNLKAFEARYYLFLVPLLGAGVGAILRRVAQDAGGRALKLGLLSLVSAGALLAGVKAYTDSASRHHDDQELVEAVPAVRQAIGQPARIVARKPHMAYYVDDAEMVFFPAVATEEELRAFLADQARGGPIYVYYGSSELRVRPQFADMLMRASTPPWLELSARSAEPDRWALYRFRNPDGSASSDGGATPTPRAN